MNITLLRTELENLSEQYSVGLKNETGCFCYLNEPTIEDDGSLMCYIPSIDDYYYVSDEITRDKNYSGPQWIDHLYFKNENGNFILFKTYIIDKYTPLTN